jgi:hypothetical protein
MGLNRPLICFSFLSPPIKTLGVCVQKTGFRSVEDVVFYVILS